VKSVTVTDEESKKRLNYQKGNVINFKDGDSTSMANYGYGSTTLITISVYPLVKSTRGKIISCLLYTKHS
jgi:hypothetical protein